MALRRTKIVATLGPALDKPEILERAIRAGIDVVRANFSHGSVDAHRARIEAVRACAERLNRTVGILIDLQGPKIRVAQFAEGAVTLEAGAAFVLDAEMAMDAGDQHAVGIDYKALPRDVSAGNVLFIDDGRIRLTVKAVEGSKIHCHVDVGGRISNHKGINLQGGGLSAGAITEKDKTDLQLAVELKADYVALSFVRSSADIREARELMGEKGRYIDIIAKIERAEAVEAIKEIVEAAGGIMVARGDLSVEIGDAEVPGVQKTIISKTRNLNKPVITATQMMDSMIHSAVPTRAEVSDIANAVLDGTDAVMLSAETAVGDHPDHVVDTMARICLAAEKHPKTRTSKHRVDRRFDRVDEAIAMASVYAANHMNIKAIIALTESGATPLWMSRIDSSIPIYGFSRHRLTRGKMALYRNVYPVAFDATKIEQSELNASATKVLFDRDIIAKDDFIILTKGDNMGVHGGSNAMKIIRVSDVC